MSSSNPQFGSSTFDPDSTPLGFVAPPQPLECLQGNPIPPFLCKIFDLVDDPNLDPIISWGPTGESFVVWDIVEFSRIILPRNFKHNNFSSFVRQLNTYGFRKVDADKWEFANKRFLQGKKHLLKNIQRRKSSRQSQTPRLGLRCEIENLRAEKSVMMQEVIQLQQQIRGTAQGVERVKHKLEASEKRQKQMVSFLAKVIQNPEFVGSPRTKRKFLKQKHVEPELLASTTPDFLLEDGFAEGDMAFPIEGVLFNELEASNDLFEIPEQSEDMAEYLVSFPEELTKQRDFPEFSSSGFDDIFNQEEVWRMGFDISTTGMSSCPDLWGNFASYEGPLSTSESPPQFIDPENRAFKKGDSDDGFKSSIDT